MDTTACDGAVRVLVGFGSFVWGVGWICDVLPEGWVECDCDGGDCGWGVSAGC